MGANELQGMVNLEPRGMIDRIYVGDHLTLLHTKYLSSGPYGFREEDRPPSGPLWKYRFLYRFFLLKI